jgi:hypothetical protein
MLQANRLAKPSVKSTGPWHTSNSSGGDSLIYRSCPGRRLTVPHASSCKLSFQIPAYMTACACAQACNTAATTSDQQQHANRQTTTVHMLVNRQHTMLLHMLLHTWHTSSPRCSPVHICKEQAPIFKGQEAIKSVPAACVDASTGGTNHNHHNLQQEQCSNTTRSSTHTKWVDSTTLWYKKLRAPELISSPGPAQAHLAQQLFVCTSTRAALQDDHCSPVPRQQLCIGSTLQ